MKLADMCASISKREKALIITAMVVVVGVIVAYVVIMFQEGQPRLTAAPPKGPTARIGTGLPAVKILGSIDVAKSKNPFEVPAQYQEQRNSTTPARPIASLQPIKPVLSGILFSGGSKLAIFEYHGNSEMVGPGAALGQYSVVSITDSQVILAGPEGQLVMNIGR